MFTFKLQDFREDPESKAVAEVQQKLFEVRRFWVHCSLWVIILHSIHHLFTDWLKVYSEFSKSAPGMSDYTIIMLKTSYYTIIMLKTLKVTGNHVMCDHSA